MNPVEVDFFVANRIKIFLNVLYNVSKKERWSNPIVSEYLAIKDSMEEAYNKVKSSYTSNDFRQYLEPKTITLQANVIANINKCLTKHIDKFVAWQPYIKRDVALFAKYV